MDVMLAYTGFDRPYAAPPGVPKERLQILRESERMLKDIEFAAEAKEAFGLGRNHLSERRATSEEDRRDGYPAPEIIKRVKEIPEES